MKTEAPPSGPFLGGFYFMGNLYKPCPKDVVSQLSEYLDCQFMKKDFFKFTKFDHFLPLMGHPKGASPLIFANFNPHSPKMLPTKFVRNQFNGFGEEVV